MPTTLPARVIHADWGIAPGKRWMARAEFDERGLCTAHATERVGNASTLIERGVDGLRPGRSCLFGFDFPIGLPAFYTRAAGISSFPHFLKEIGHGRWSRFADVAEKREEISLERPFYPMRPGGTKQSHLLEALEATGIDQLRRRCERRQATRGAACPLFWTLGGQQVGKGALSGWREVIVPALQAEKESVSIWPFGGSLDDLIAAGQVILAETYPAEFYGHLGVSFPASRAETKSGKRVQGDRVANAPALLSWAESSGTELEPGLADEIEDGFGSGADGEDRFDAVVGLFGMLNVLLGRRPSVAPDEDEVRLVEGWILGQSW